MVEKATLAKLLSSLLRHSVFREEACRVWQRGVEQQKGILGFTHAHEREREPRPSSQRYHPSLQLCVRSMGVMYRPRPFNLGF